MSHKNVKLFIIGVFVVTSLSCSLTQCSGRSSVSSNNTGSPSLEPTQVEVKLEATQEEYHPGHILYSNTGGLYFFDLDTSHSTLVVVGNIRSGKVSPDGQYLAYLTDSDDPDSWKTSDLSVLDLETGELLDTSAFPEDANTYIWSKEPGRITFTRRNWDYCAEFVDRQITGLYQYNVLTNETATLHIGTDQYVFWLEEWSPDGHYLLFSHGPDCSEGRSLMYYDQTGEVDGVPFAEASWSPDGNSLAANGTWYWEPEDLPLIQYNVATGESVELFFEPGHYVSSPVWSPDGNWIAFILSPSENYDPHPIILNIVTGEVQEIPLAAGRPNFWIEENNSLILTITNDDQTRDVYVYKLDSFDLIKILGDITGYATQWVR